MSTLMMLAEINVHGSVSVALAALGSALGVGFVGAKAVESVGRNPGAFPKVLTMAIIGAALAEAIVFYTLFIPGA